MAGLRASRTGPRAGHGAQSACRPVECLARCRPFRSLVHLVWHLAHGRVLTTCVRVDRFSEGDLADAFEAGLIGRAVLRAGQLLAALEARLGRNPGRDAPGTAWVAPARIAHVRHACHPSP